MQNHLVMQNHSDYEKVIIRSIEREISDISNSLMEKYQKIVDDPTTLGTTTTASGILALSLAVIGFSPELGVITTISVGLAAASGIAQTGLGLAQLLSVVIGGGDLLSPIRIEADLAVDIASNPYSLVLGTVGIASNGEMKPGVELGKLISATVNASGIYRDIKSSGENQTITDMLSTLIGFLQVNYSDISKLGRYERKQPTTLKTGNSFIAPSTKFQETDNNHNSREVENQRLRKSERQRQQQEAAQIKGVLDIHEAEKEWERRNKMIEERLRKEEKNRQERQQQEAKEQKRRKEAAEEVERAAKQCLEQAEHESEETRRKYEQLANEASTAAMTAAYVLQAGRIARGVGGVGASPELDQPAKGPVNMLP